MEKVLMVGASRKTHGGVTTVIKAWEKSAIWQKYHCRWIETQDNRGLDKKLYYLLTSIPKALFYVPQYDIVHFHTTPGRSVLVQLPIFLICLIFRKKTILHLHVGNQLHDYLNDKLFKWVLGRTNRVVVLAEVWKKLLLELYGKKSEVVYNPIRVVKTHQEERKKWILYAGFFVKNKGYDTILKAIQKICLKYPEWKLIMCGTGEIDQINTFIRENNLLQVELKGWQSAGQMEKFYQKSSIYCIASEKEGFPMSALEAWAYKVPLVTTPVGGLVDVIKNHENSLVFPYGDSDSLALCLEELIKSEELRKSIAENAHKMAMQKFSIQAIEKQLSTLYQSL